MKVDTGKRFYDARTKLNQHMKDGKEESINTVGRNTDVPVSSISLYERGDRIPNTKNAQILAEYYGVNVAWLLGQSDSYTLNEDSQIVTKLTGLSSDVVEWLSSVKANTDTISCLNALLSSYDFRRSLLMLTQAKKMSEQNTQDDETADMIERANSFGISHGMKPEDSRISNRQLIRMYRSDGLLDMGNAFRKIAPSDESEMEAK